MGRKYFTTKTYKNISLSNNETGEELGFYQKRECKTQREFIKVYFDCISELTGCLEKGLYATMFAVWKYSTFTNNYEGNKFNNDKGFKDECRRLGINKDDKAINTDIYRLAKRKVLRKVSKGLYILNPKYFAKGTLKEDTNMKFEVEYKAPK